MSENERPRPQFGEYATPEEQRASIAEPTQWHVTADADTAAAPDAVTAHAAPPTVVGRRGDRPVTIVLLAIGLLNVVLTAASLGDGRQFAQQWMTLTGIPGQFSNFGELATMIWISNTVMVVLWALTTWLAVRAMRRGRLSWWIALAGGALAYLIMTILLSIAVLGDPAVSAYLSSVQTP